MVLFRTEAHAELEWFDHGAMNCEQILRVIRIAPRSSDHPQSRFVDTARAINWLIHLRHQSSDGMRSTRSVVCGEDDIVPS